MDRWTKRDQRNKVMLKHTAKTGRDSNGHADSEEDRFLMIDRQTN